MAIALLVYCRTADAARALSNSTKSMPPDSVRSGDRSNIELWDGRDDHWNEGGDVETFGVFGTGACAWSGTNAHAEVVSVYKSRREGGCEVMSFDVRVVDNDRG